MSDHNEREAIYKDIGKRIKSARESCDMTQDHVAKLMGLTRTSITNMERGRQRFAVDTLYELARIFETDVYELLPNIPEDVERLRELRNINDEISKLQSRAKELRTFKSGGNE